MADRFYNVALGGDQREDVAEGAADTSAFVAVRVTYDATGANKVEALKALRATIDYISHDSFPPV
jgi:hypothetical protein